jgi:N-methylhydantoinase A
VLPRFREYERTSTTVIDAYLAPLLGRYLRSLSDTASAAGLPPIEVVKSSGGAVDAAEAAGGGAWSVLSGPAGGAVGASLIARLSGDGSALGLDMGGTSCDVCVVEDGAVRLTDTREIEGRVIQLPMVDVHTVGAGGGSIAWRDHGGALRVGPQSAGADPGPACYGRGGTQPTVTDANLVLGRLASDSKLAGGVELDADAAERAIAKLAGELGLTPLETAEGIVRLADQEMVRALRVVTVERGVDPRRFALMPFGGAGPTHATAIAEELEIERILCPRAGGVLSALGLLAAPRRRDASRTVMLAGAELRRERVAEVVEAMRAELEPGMEGATVECSYELRYRGQAFELPVAAGPDPDPGELRAAFDAEHERRYGFADPDAEIELVHVNVALVERGPQPEPRAAAEEPRRSARRIRMAGEWVEAEVLRGELPAGLSVTGPAVLELPETTMVLPPTWHARVDEHGTILAERKR